MKQNDSIGRNIQLLGRFGRGGRSALQPQQAHDQLQAVSKESMLKFLRHHVWALQ
jgi:hypothetical protein